jgi:hypothetical protein
MARRFHGREMEVIHIRYNLKMKCPEIFWIALVFATSFISTAFPVLVFLVIIEILILLRRPRKFFERRLNDYFIMLRYPLSKWHSIFQSPKSCIYRSDSSVCKVFFRDLSKQMTKLFDLVEASKGYYRFTTHEVIKKRIEMLEQQGKLKIICCKPTYRKNLVQLQNLLLHHGCRQCPQAGCCYYRQVSIKKGNFTILNFTLNIN